ncbi:MAG: hypothetical protein IKI03_09195 [Clostridia bacterium]|nr:hypothetical protein [Clostridia bacterium]
MKALVIGTAASMWVKEFIGRVLLPEGMEVTVLRDPTAKCKYSDFYEENGVKFAGLYTPSSFMMKIPRIRKYYKQRRTIKALSEIREKFDYIFIVSSVAFYVKCAGIVYQEGTKVFALYIGSDILRAKDKDIAVMKPELSRMKAVIVPVSKKPEAACARRLLDGKKPDHVIDFGSSQIECIDAYSKEGRGASKSALGIDEDALTICVGHNGFESQQHLKLLDAISSLPPVLKDRVTLILPMTYGGRKKYRAEVKDAAGSFRHVIFDSFMDSDTVARLRVASDVYINAQVTDALSTSMLEHIYAGCEVLVGSWLSYPELREWGVSIGEFADFNELAGLIEKRLVGQSANKEELERNHQILHRYLSWETCRKKWHEVVFG